MRRIFALLTLFSLAACGAQPLEITGQFGRPSYEGSGFVRNVAAARSEATQYRAHAARTYAQPGPMNDSWGPYIQEAANRFGIPEAWVREVMRQESGGRQYAGGALVTSWAGAMGLMQVMPSTYDVLRHRYGLGSDPYDPRDNILAGAAYIREMYDRFGSPNFLAAYNAGPDRVDAFLTGGARLPNETIGYVAAIAPRLGLESAATGAYTAAAQGRVDEPGWGSRRSARVSLASYTTSRVMAGPEAAEEVAMAQPVATLVTAPVHRLPSGPGNWAIEVGAFADADTSRATMKTVRGALVAGLNDTPSVFIPEQRDGTTLNHARLVGLNAADAALACDSLLRHGLSCVAIPPGS